MLSSWMNTPAPHMTDSCHHKHIGHQMQKKLCRWHGNRNNICARVNIFETKYKITSYDRNLTNFFPQLLLEIFLKQKVLKIIHFWEKYYPIRHAGRDLSQKNYKRLHFLRASLHVYMSKKLVLFRFSFLFSVLKIACYLD